MDSDSVALGLASEASRRAITFISQNGYHSVTAEAIADEVGTSRSTFFRRYGGKDDVIFADHDLLLQTVESILVSSALPPLEAVVSATRAVFDYHVSNEEITRARHRLIHSVPALRDRELIAIRRYERAFALYLGRVLPEVFQRESVIAGFSSAVVGIHNGALRKWLDTGNGDIGTELERQLNWLKGLFESERDTARDAVNVVVSIVPATASRQDIVSAVQSAMELAKG